MKQLFVKMCAVVAAVCGLTAFGDYTTSRVISVNFGSGKGVATADSGLNLVSADAWGNLSVASNTRTDLKTWTGSAAETLSSNWSITWSSKSTYQWTDATDPMLDGYLDDGSGVSATFKNLPFSCYDVYVYCATDDANAGGFSPVEVNGVKFTSDTNGDGVAGTAAWGASRSLTCVKGTNVIVIKRLSDSTLNLKTYSADAGRACVAGIQIVESSDSPRIHTASLSGDANISALAWDPVIKDDYSTEMLVINMTADSTLTYDTDKVNPMAIRFTGNKKLTLKVADGVTVPSLTWVTSDFTGTLAMYDCNLGITAVGSNGTLSYAGTTALTTFPMIDTSFSGYTVEVARPYTTDGQLKPVGNKTYSLNSDITADYITLGNNGNVTQTYTQKSGTVLANSSNEPTSTTAALLIGHWAGTVTYNLEDGELNVPNAAIRVGWDGNGTLNIKGGKVTTPGFRGAGFWDGGWTRTGAGTIALVGGEADIGSYGIQFNTGYGTLTLDSGTLKVSDNATLTVNTLNVGGNATVEIADGKTVSLKAANVAGTGYLVKKGTGELAIPSGRPTMDVQEGSVKLTATTEEIAAAKLVLSVPAGASTATADKVTIVNANGEEIDTVGNPVIDEDAHTVTITLDVNGAITESGDIGTLIKEGTTGLVVINGTNTEEAITITFNGSIPADVTEIQVIGNVILQGTIPAIVKPVQNATITIDTATTIANSDSTVSYIVIEGGTLKISGTAPKTIRVDEGGTFDVNGVADTSYPVVLNGGTMTNSGRGVGYGSKQNWQVSVTADSYIDTDNEFGMVASGWGNINFSLAGHKLTKKGSGQFVIATTTFVGGGTIDIQKGNVDLYSGFAVPASTTLTLNVGAEGSVSISGTVNKSGTLNITGTGTVTMKGTALDFGSASGFTEKFVAQSGSNTVAWVGGGSTEVCTTDSKDAPFITINSGAILGIDGKDFSGWNGGITEHSWIVNNGTFIFLAGTGSRFFRDHLVLGNGSTTRINTGSRRVLLYGGAGSADAAQIMLPSGTATIAVGTEGNGAALFFGNDGEGGYGSDKDSNKGAGISVGADATLTISAPVQGSDPMYKYGEGTLDLTNTANTYSGAVTLYAGTIKSATALTVTAADGHSPIETASSEEGYTYTLGTRTVATRIVASSFDFDSFTYEDTGFACSLVAGDTVIIPAGCPGSQWGVGGLSNIKGHPVEINYGDRMNWKIAVVSMKISSGTTVFLRGDAGASLGTGTMITGEGTAKVAGEDDAAITLNVTGAASILSNIIVSNGSTFKLTTDTASLTVNEVLADGVVTTDVVGKKVVSNEVDGKIVYSLANADHTVYFVGNGIVTAFANTATPAFTKAEEGAAYDYDYTIEDGKAVSFTVTVSSDYQAETLMIDGATKNGDVWTTANITADTTLTATATAKTPAMKLADAIAAAESGATVALTEDVTDCCLEITKSLTIDLAGKTWTATAGGTAIKVNAADITVTITDSSDDQTGKVVVPDGAGYCVWTRIGNTIIDAGTFENSSNDDYTLYVGTNDAGLGDADAPTLTINGGTFVNKNTDPYLYKKEWHSININVRNYNATTDTKMSVDLVQVKGGTFTWDPALGDDNMGGTFVADGYVSTDNEDGTWTVAKKSGPTIPEGQGEIVAPTEEGGNYVVKPADGQKEITISNLPEGAKVEVPATVTTVTGVPEGKLVVTIADAKTTGTTYDITSALDIKVVDGVTTVGDVKQTVADDAITEGSVETLASTDENATIATVPGLYYQVIGDTDVGFGTKQTGDKVQATTAETTLPKPNLGTTTKAFYKVQVTK